MRPSQRHSVNASRLREFRNAYVQLINASIRNDTFPRTSMGPLVDTKDWMALFDAVSRSAGPAGPIYLIYGPIYQTHSGPWVNGAFNPVVGWKTSIDDIEQFPPQTLIAALDGAIARAETESLDSQIREKGITGLIARFIRWPLELREAVGRGAAVQNVAMTIGFIGQVLVGLSTAWVIYLIKLLTNNLLG